MPDRVKAGRKVVHFLIPVHEVHGAIVVVVVVRTLGCVDWQHEVVGSQPVSLCVSIAEDTGLEHLVITVSNSCNNSSMTISTSGLCTPTPTPTSDYAWWLKAALSHSRSSLYIPADTQHALSSRWHWCRHAATITRSTQNIRKNCHIS